MYDGSLVFDTRINREGFENGLKRLSGLATKAAIAVGAGFATMGAYALKGSIDFESAFAGVKKTIDATDGEYEALRKNILSMSKELPASAIDIAGVAEAAGQLGIQKDNILGFTQTMIDLGEATNLTSDQAATSLARFANIMKTPQTAFSNLGSTIVALGNNMATTESEIVEMGLRVAGTGAQVGFTEAQVLALSAAMSSMGINAEAGGSSVSRVMQKINNDVLNGGKGLRKFAKVSGMSAEDFAKTWKANPQDALISFVKGLGDVNKEGGSVSMTLKELGIRSVQEIDALSRMSNNVNLLTDAFNIGNQAYQENIALQQEAEQRYSTTESRIQILKNNVTDLAIAVGDGLKDSFNEGINAGIDNLQRLSESLNDGALKESLAKIGDAFGRIVEKLAGFAADHLPSLIDGLADLVENADKLATGLGLAATAFLTFKTFSFLSGLASAFQTATLQIQLFTMANSGATVAQGVLNGTFTAFETFVALLTGRITLHTIATKALTVAQGFLNAVMNANPFVLIATLLVAVTGVLITLWHTNENFRNAVKAAWSDVKQVFSDTLEKIKQGLKAAADIGKNLIEGIKKGIEAKAKELYDKVKEVSDKVIGGFKSFFGIHSPSRVMDEEVGQNLGKGIAQGISKSDKYILKAIDTTHDRIKKAEQDHTRRMLILQQDALNKSNKRLADLGISSINDRYSRYAEAEKAQIKTVAEAIDEIEKALEVNKSTRRDENNRAKLDANKKILEGEKEVLQAEKKHLEEYSKEYEKVFAGMQAEYEKAYDAILDKQNSLADKLKAFGDLIEKTKTDAGVEVIKLADVNKQISTIEQYGDILDKLKSRGADVDVMNKLLSMSIEDAVQYGTLLLQQSDSDFDAYMKAMEKKRETANQIAKKYYENELDTLKSDYTDRLAENLGEIPDLAEGVGVEAAESMGHAFGETLSPLMSEMAREAMENARAVMLDENARIAAAKREKAKKSTKSKASKREATKKSRDDTSKVLNQIAVNTGNTNKNIERMPRRTESIRKMI